MTRINSAISVKLLTDEHLLAEHREIKRLPFNFKLRKDKGLGCDSPPEFKLGTGHVMFFADRGLFTLKRYVDIRNECLIRGFSIEDYSSNWEVYCDYVKDYIPTNKEHFLLINRIAERLMQSTKQYWHYCGNRITKEQAVKLLSEDYVPVR